MNYRHAFHAGNHADILKHVILSRVITLLVAKGNPMALLDAHAGSGVYDLMGAAAGKTVEWQSGIGKMAAGFDAETEALLTPFRSVVSRLNGGGAALRYPGSPVFAADLLGPQDRIILNELQAEEKALLEIQHKDRKGVRVTGLDATVAIKAHLPFAERRGIVLIDPPYEEKAESEKVLRMVTAGVQRQANAVFVIWYPIVSDAFAEQFTTAIGGLKLPASLHAQLWVREVFEGGGLAGSGVIVINAPWTLDGELAHLLPALAGRLGQGKGGRSDVAWLVPPT